MWFSVFACLSPIWGQRLPWDLSSLIYGRRIVDFQLFSILFFVQTEWWLPSSSHARSETEIPNLFFYFILMSSCNNYITTNYYNFGSYLLIYFSVHFKLARTLRVILKNSVGEGYLYLIFIFTKMSLVCKSFYNANIFCIDIIYHIKIILLVLLYQGFSFFF